MGEVKSKEDHMWDIVFSYNKEYKLTSWWRFKRRAELRKKRRDVLEFIINYC